MDASSSRWHEITPSSFDHERAALEYVRELLPDRVPYQAWSNFTFMSDQGHIREVDLLVAAPTGLFLIEIKNYRDRLTNHGSLWVLSSGRSFDNPLWLADQKAKELKSLLERAARKDRNGRVPFLRGCLFLAEPGMRCDLEEAQRNHLYVPKGSDAAKLLPTIDELLLGAVRHAPPSADFFRNLPRLLEQVGVHRTRRSVSVGPWQINPRPYDSAPTWQDHEATREDIPGQYRRIRIYLYERQADPQARESVRNAAQRELTAAQGIEHPGLLVPRDLLDHQMGPALVIEQQKDAVRLDHFMAAAGAKLDLPARLELIRQLAEAVKYAHDRRLVHRALSARAVIVESDADGRYRPRVGEWQAAARGLSSMSTVHRVAPTTHAGRHVEAAAAAYLAPEFTQDADGTVSIDVFGLGAIAYLVLTGKPPADSRAALGARLAEEGGLSPSAVAEGIPPDVDALIALATAPRITDRIPDVEAFLDGLDEALEESAPADAAMTDPLEAQPGTELPDGYVVEKVLGTGASARAFLVERDGLRSVLKVGRTAQAESRLDDEAAALDGLHHDHVVVIKRGVFALGSRHAIEIDYAGDQTLAGFLRTEGALLPDQLQRFGEQLLYAVGYLERQDLFHRDIKPDNLGIRRRPKKAPELVLFDFSLSRAPATDVVAGTRGYRDPFLGTDRRPSYDRAAELYAAAATLHEMASLEVPSWGEDGTDAQFVDEVTLASDIFDSALREPLTAFFARALHRDAEQRFPTAAAMRKAWQQVFTTMDAEAPARTSYSESDDPQQRRSDAAAAATATTALSAAGLSLRAVAVAQRLGADTVGELVEIPTRMLWRARGLSRTTRLELVNQVSAWRRALPVTATEPQVEAAEGATGPLGLDTLAARLLPVSRAKGADQRAIARSVLGLPDDDGTLPSVRWPTLAEVAATHGLTGARIGQLTQKRRLEWSKDDAVMALRGDVAAALRDRGRVAAAGELVEQLLLARGCDREQDADRRQSSGYAVLRAVVEADAVAESPAFATRRHRDRVLVALQVGDDESFDTPNDAELLDMAAGLADEAVRLAGHDPLPTPGAVVRALEAVARRFDQLPGEQRLVQLASAASGSVLANARLELYPADLDLVRALRLSQAGAGIPADGLSPEALARRVSARFPGIRPLPDGAELLALLRQADMPLHWQDDKLVPPGSDPSTSSTRYSGTSISSTIAQPATSGGPGTGLQRLARHGGVRMVTFRGSRWAGTREHVRALLGTDIVDASAAFVEALRGVARDRRIADFELVLRADAPDADQRARTNLNRVAAEAWERLEQAWCGTNVLVLDALTPFSRYPGGMPLLERLLASARVAGRNGGPSAVVLLCAAANERDAPAIGTEAIGLASNDEWLIAPASWKAPPKAA